MRMNKCGKKVPMWQQKNLMGWQIRGCTYVPDRENARDWYLKAHPSYVYLFALGLWLHAKLVDSIYKGEGTYARAEGPTLLNIIGCKVCNKQINLANSAFIWLWLLGYLRRQGKNSYCDQKLLIHCQNHKIQGADSTMDMRSGTNYSSHWFCKYKSLLFDDWLWIEVLASRCGQISWLSWTYMQDRLILPGVADRVDLFAGD